MCGTSLSFEPGEDPQKAKELESNSITLAWPEDPPSSLSLCSWWARQWNIWTYKYMEVVLEKGARQRQTETSSSSSSLSNDDDAYLSLDDLFRVPKSMSSTHLVKVFEEANSNKNNSTTAPLYKILWKIAAPTFVPAGICELVVVLCGVTLPLLVRELLHILETNPNVSVLQKGGLVYALSIFAVSLMNGFCNHRHRHLALKTGVALRASVVNILYQHILRLSPQGKASMTSGEVANLVAVDTQKLFEVTQEGHLIWALPLSIILVSGFLLQTLGISTLVGITVLILFVPLIERVTSRMWAVRQQRAKFTDSRVEIISTLLQGIQITKLNHYEPNYKTRIVDTRQQELKLLSREMAIWATTLLMTVSSPMLATGVTFATYVLMGDGKVLTAADAFGVLLLFSALRFPINFAGRLIGKAAQALSAMRRISVFLQRPLRDGSTEQYVVGVEQKDNKTTKSCDDTFVAYKAELDANGCTELVQGRSRLESCTAKGAENIAPLLVSEASFRIGASTNTTEQGKEEEDKEKTMTADSAKMPSTTASSNGFTVSKFDFSIPKGNVIAVCGPVGCGKSTLLNGILGETEVLGGTVQITGKLSYVPQTPFILNQTLRENILFGLPLDRERYEQVLDACCLRPDLEQLKDGDETEIGERGVTLSGGQKQRVSLARAAYAKPDIVLLDDPFSALDSGTGKVVFERLIGASSSIGCTDSNALFYNTAVLLVTHASHFITNRAVDQILLIVDGQNQFLGSWEELATFYPKDESTVRAVEHIKASIREESEDEKEQSRSKETKEEVVDKNDKSEVDTDRAKGRLMQIERREHGLSSIKTWLLWFQRAGGVPFFATQVLLMSIDRFLYVAVELFIAQWTSATESPVDIIGIEFPAQSDGVSSQSRYLKVYAILIAMSVFSTFVRSEWAVTGGLRATRNVFDSMLASVLRAPMSYFETVPMGRILNRFTYDTDVNDVNLTQVMSMFMISCSWYVAGVTLQCSILPWSALAIFPVSAVYWILMLHYRMSGPDLQRIDALSRSPLQSMVSECLEGSTSIRVFNQVQNFVNRFRQVADDNSSALLNFVSAQRWLGVRMELLGSIVVLVSSVLVVCLNDVLKLEAGLAGLLIMWSSNFTITLNFMVDTFSEAEAAITSIERVDAMADLPKEKPMDVENEHRPPESWPEKGLLEFNNVDLRYREGLPLALRSLSFKIPAGKSCGVVGRTGAGKSSLTVALFRLVEIESGTICLDGVNLSELGLSDVRGRGMSIIPQDPFLAGATLRECLDPFQHHTDTEILDALNAVRLGTSSNISGVDKAQLLSSKVEEGGSNYSVGERQLLNLARALLSQPKLLVLDEATASIDGETDAFIQKMLRTRFPTTTLITIAHRLHTIMDYDLCLVMDAGHAVEFGAPAELLNIKSGVFAELVDATGAESSKALREMVKAAK